MKALEDKRDKQTGPIMPEEIEAIKAKHTGLLKRAHKVFWDALEIGDWFIQAQSRVKKHERGAGWRRWVQDNFAGEISVETIYKYMRLALNRQFLKAKLESVSQLHEFDRLPSLRQALGWIEDREATEGGKSRKRNRVIDVEASQGSVNGAHTEEPPWRPIKIPPPPELAVELEEQGVEVENPDPEPLAILRDCFKSYVSQRNYLQMLQDQLQHLEAEIAERIRVAELSPAQVQRAVDWACRGQDEVKDIVLKVFLR
jgi:hypothetical protein